MNYQINNLPLVSVIILSYNRKEQLAITLQKLNVQSYSNIEIIVVDNCSIDGSVEMISSNYTEVNLISLTKNIGIGAYNLGIKEATGSYIMFLDDDSYPEDKTIEAGVQIIENNNYDIVAFDILERGVLRSSKPEALTNFSACGVLISERVFQKIGGFQEELFLYVNEIEFTLRAYDCGFRTYFSSSIVTHNLNVKNRENRSGYDKRKFYYDTRNIIIILIQKFYFQKVFFRILRIMAGRFFFSIRKGLFLTYLNVLKYLAKNIFTIFKYKSHLSFETQKYFSFAKFSGGFFFVENKYKIQN